MKPDYEREGVRLFNRDCREVLPLLGTVECIATDPPFSARTHEGHDASSAGHLGFGFDGANRSALGYEAWTEADAREFINIASAHCSGWMVVFNDHCLAVPIQKAMEDAGRYAFAPLSYYAPGSCVRLSGDGPSSWTIWIVVSRTKAQARWGTLPGGYVAQEGWREREHMGGKPTKLMEAIVGDYSRKGETVCDPYMGRASTGVACIRLGRPFIGIEIDAQTFDAAVRRIEAAFEETSLLDYTAKQEQLTL